MYIAPFSFAPTELGLVCDCRSYKYSAPMELRRLVAALARCSILEIYGPSSEPTQRRPSRMTSAGIS